MPRRVCEKCVHVKESSAQKPFHPQDGSTTYTCTTCKRRWWKAGKHSELWVLVANDETWQNILNGSLLPIKIGDTARNWTQKQMKRFLRSPEAHRVLHQHP